MYEVSTREIPARHLLCLKRNVSGWDQAWALGKEFVGVFKSRPLARMEGRAGASRSFFCIYWSEVSEDSDGPLEWCRPIAGDRAEEIAGQYPEMTLRTEPAHREAFVSMGPAMEISPPQWQLVSQSLHAWAEGRSIRPTDLGMRITYLASDPPDLTRGPDCDFAVPFDDMGADAVASRGT